MPPNEQDWQSFYAVVLKKSGLDLNLYKAPQLRRRILGMLEMKKIPTLPAFGEFVSASGENMEWFLDKLAINVSELYRNPEKWNELQLKILPELLKRTQTLKIWSAGCSYGAEAHSMAVMLDAFFPGNHRIEGTDIDQEALTQAKAGEFSEGDMRAVPKDLLNKYFVKQATGWLAKPELKKFLSFRTGNILKDRFDTGYDLIMCRNVVIYFTEEAKQELYKRFFDSLKPGGMLFVGSTERIFGSKEIGFESPLPFFYQKPLLGDLKCQNAS